MIESLFGHTRPQWVDVMFGGSWAIGAVRRRSEAGEEEGEDTTAATAEPANCMGVSPGIAAPQESNVVYAGIHAEDDGETA